VMSAFNKGGRGHQGARVHTGERAIVRAYLASLIHFFADVYGPDALHKVFGATANTARNELAKAAGVSLPTLELRWHLWLDQKAKARAHR